MEQQEHMRYDSLILLRKNDYSWRMLASDHAEFSISFLYEAFLTEQRRDISESTLEQQKNQIDEEILRIKQGDLDTLFDLQLKDRFRQALTISHQIISDFREMEGNFRTLHRDMREKISSWDGGQGRLSG